MVFAIIGYDIGYVMVIIDYVLAMYWLCDWLFICDFYLLLDRLDIGQDMGYYWLCYWLCIGQYWLCVGQLLVMLLVIGEFMI